MAVVEKNQWKDPQQRLNAGREIMGRLSDAERFDLLVSALRQRGQDPVDGLVSFLTTADPACLPDQDCADAVGALWGADSVCLHVFDLLTQRERWRRCSDSVEDKGYLATIIRGLQNGGYDVAGQLTGFARTGNAKYITTRDGAREAAQTWGAQRMLRFALTTLVAMRDAATRG